MSSAPAKPIIGGIDAVAFSESKPTMMRRRATTKKKKTNFDSDEEMPVTSKKKIETKTSIKQ